ncbi:PIG-L family deacetylase [bacterium]|nr:PIG-L family deacetylase [candidate division CSSED10-310 bacterium]
MSFSGPAKWFQALRYGAIARAVAHMNRRYRFTGSPEFRPLVEKASQNAVVLSISPHPDDDVLAVGGALAGHIVAGGRVHSIVMTDGIKGTSGAAADERLAELRRLECDRAAAVLKLTSVEYWHLPDGKLQVTEDTVRSLVRMIRDLSPDYIYTPFPIDYHFDHVAATGMVVAAVSEISEPPLIRCYESIIPLVPNLIIDITDFIDLKRRAVECFETQNAVSDYVRTIVDGLNRHRSYGAMKGRGYGEAIFETEWRLIRDLSDIVHGKPIYGK